MQQMSYKVKEIDNKTWFLRQNISVLNQTKTTILLNIIVQNVPQMRFDYMNISEIIFVTELYRVKVST